MERGQAEMEGEGVMVGRKGKKNKIKKKRSGPNV